jgi:HEPN domain-containing protein
VTSIQAEGFIERAGKKLQDARSDLQSVRFDTSISNSIESIELSAKATFLLLGEKYPTDHTFKDVDVAVLFAKLPEQVTYYNFPRLFVLHELWQTFYTLSKYGKDEWGIPAKQLVKAEEAELAAHHASEWNTATVVLRSVLDALKT